MDIDGSSVGEIDQNLLLQFSCMNTTDRDELINQMQRLLGPSMNYNTASFFLDMSNWNLQTAICCYLDYTLPPKLPSMSLKAAQTQEAAVGPGACFEQSWNIANTGAEGWPGSCRLVQGGDTLWVEITVESEITMALVEQLAALPVPSSNGQMPPQDDQMC
ncbi:hypothetical protein HF086_011640 [Spodoptera exigua]|uniref:Next to BRCA1 central domain-containing protein n=1 Tax=Spodoptera exigua TaxID=7107 RepID=A0A922MQW7_SPOEX|nr:hypothetical protein HF086_011640 [Spodoptera exigua]